MDENQELPDDIQADILAAQEGAAPQREQPSLPEGDIIASPTGGEIASEIGTGVAQGALEATTMTGAPILGAKMGMTAGAPFGPVGIGVGGTLGFLGGAGAGYLAQESINDLFPGVSREDLAPYREGGRTFGQTMAVAPYAFAIPVQRTNQIATFIRNMDPALRNVPGGIASGRLGEFIVKTASLAGETARKYPKSFMTGETLAGVGAGFGAGIAESQAPGEPGPRFAGEVIGGFLSPGRMTMTATGSAKDFLGTLMNSVSKDSREGRAADKLFTILEEAGEDPAKLARDLMKVVPEGVSPSAAQMTGSPALSVLETTLAKNNAQYRGNLLKQAEESLKAYKLLVRGMQDIGTPEALAKAAELRQNYFNKMLTDRLALAEAEAARRVSNITADTPQNRAAIGDIVRRQTEDALKDSRDHEKFLWKRAYESAIEQTTKDGETVLRYKEVQPAALGETFLEIATSMTPERFSASMPASVKSMMKRMGIDNKAIQRYREGKQTEEYLATGKVPANYMTRAVDPEPSVIELPKGVSRPVNEPEQVTIFKNTDAQDLVNVRSDLLAFARDAGSKGEVANAGFFGRMAESALDDLGKLNSPAYDEARQFSRTLNDTFTRTYAGDVASAQTRTGAQRLPAEILVTRAFGSNADVTALRMQEIQNAVGMMGQQYDNAVRQFGIDSPQATELRPFADAARQRVDSIYDAQQRVLRLAASKTINPDTGRINPRTLQNFVNENRAMLDQFGVTSDLQDAVQAENVLRSVIDTNSYANNRLRKQTAFGMVLGAENPTRVVTDALRSRYPFKNFSNIVKLAKSDGQNAVDGLKSTIYDYAFTKAGGMDNFDPSAFRKAIFEPLSPGQPSILNIMRSQDVMDKGEVRRLLQLIRPMERIAKARGSDQVMDEVVGEADAVTELAMRVVGARLGTAASPGGPASLIAASAGSKAVRSIFDKQPTLMIRGIIEQATQDPKLMAMLLQRGTTEAQQRQTARNLHAYLGAAGLNYSTYDEPAQEEQSQPRTSFEMLRQMPSAPVTRGTPNLQLPTDQGPAGQALDRMTTDQGAAPAATPAPPPGPTSSSREMFQRLFPNEMG